MLDVFNIPGQQDNVKIYYAQSGSNSWQTWQKPRNCKFIWMMCIGGAAGGFSGQGSVTTAGTQGNGGGSAAVTRALFPANTLPDTLFIQPGQGGAGATGTAAGPVLSGTGNTSWVSSTPQAANMSLILYSGNSPASAGTGEVALSATPFMGTFQSVVGVAGTTGAATALSTTIVTAGAGGGGVAASVASAGFSIAAISNITFVTPAIPGGAATGENGSNGLWSWRPFYGVGGAGGGANLSGAGGNGGNGAYGCGGGGGGCGSTNGGSGGKGGDGLVIIISF